MVIRYWALIIADFRREYQMDADTLGGLSVDEFLWLLQGLSDKSRYVKAWRDAPRNVYTEADIAAVHSI